VKSVTTHRPWTVALCRLLLWLGLSGVLSARAHDVCEIGAAVYLHTNRVELNVVLVRPTIMRAADAQGVHLLDFSRPDERENALPVLRSQGGKLFILRLGTNQLAALPVTVNLGQDDHVNFRLTYPTPIPRGTNDLLTLEAKVLSHLPTDERYAVSLTMLDMVNPRVVSQKLLRSGAATCEVTLPPPVGATPTPGASVAHPISP
jgi:hypothetical protein